MTIQSVAVFPLVKFRDKLLVWTAIRTGTEHWRGMWETPGGKLAVGDNTLVDAMVREYGEETGLVLNPFQVYPIDRTGPHVNPTASVGVQEYFVTWYYTPVHVDARPINTEPDKRSDWRLINLEEFAVCPIMPGTSQAIEYLLKHKNKVIKYL